MKNTFNNIVSYMNNKKIKYTSIAIIFILLLVIIVLSIRINFSNKSVTTNDLSNDTVSTNEAATNEGQLYAGAAEYLLGNASCYAPLANAECLTSSKDSVLSSQDNSAEEENEYANLAIADVDNYVNIRDTSGTDGQIVGKLYDGSVAEILNSIGSGDDLWFQIKSGDVEGYIKAEFLIYGDAASEVIDDYIIHYARVDADRLNIRLTPDTAAKRIGYLDNGAKVKILETEGDWYKVQYTDTQTGYIASEYTSVWEEFIYAKSIEQEMAEIAAAKALLARNQVSEESAPEQTTNSYSFANANTSYTSNEELRSSIIEYAKQYLGNKYVHGGQSLAGGTDCSGFTCYIYAEYGYSISRTPSGQYSSAGRSISSSEIQPGDIVCYSSSGGKCTHVALYIGDGQIIHEANSRKGVITSAVDYDTIIGIKNVID